MQIFCRKIGKKLVCVLEKNAPYQITYNIFHTKEQFSMNRFCNSTKEFVEVKSKSPLYKQGLLLSRNLYLSLQHEKVS